MTDYSNLLERARDKASDYRQPYGCAAIIAALADAIEALQARLVVTDKMVERTLEHYWDVPKGEWTAVQIRFMRAVLEAALSQENG